MCMTNDAHCFYVGAAKKFYQAQKRSLDSTRWRNVTFFVILFIFAICTVGWNIFKTRCFNVPSPSIILSKIIPLTERWLALVHDQNIEHAPSTDFSCSLLIKHWNTPVTITDKNNWEPNWILLRAVLSEMVPLIKSQFLSSPRGEKEFIFPISHIFVLFVW